MKYDRWSLALAVAGVVSFGSLAHAEEAQNQVLTALSSTTLSGYIDTSAIWRLGTGQGFIPGRVFDNADKMDGFNLHAVKLSLEKPLDEGQWSAGYKVDLIFGPDANYYSAILNGGNWNGGDQFAIKQAYAAFRAPIGNGVDFKMGVFDPIVGYEVFDSGNNPNFSRSYAFGMEPVHHTGILASYHINDMISVAAGIANTWTGAINGRPARSGSGFDPADETEKTYMASVTITLPESAGPFSGSALYAGIVDGLSSSDVLSNVGSNPDPAIPAGTSRERAKDTTHFYVGHTMATPVEGLSIGLAFDYREDGPNSVAIGDNWAWAAAFYSSYQATEKLRLNGRAEWTKGSNGTYYTLNSADPSNELFALTLTADYTLWSSLITRLEARWDRALEGRGVFAGNAAPGNALLDDLNTDRNNVTLALNLVYKF
jgi:hypothetical protein